MSVGTLLLVFSLAISLTWTLGGSVRPAMRMMSHHQSIPIYPVMPPSYQMQMLPHSYPSNPSHSSFILLHQGFIMGSIQAPAPYESGSVSTPVVPKIMTVQTLHGILYDRKDADKYFIFDVREPEEVNTRKRLQVEGVIYLPLGEQENWEKLIRSIEKLDRSKPAIVICQTGVRSKIFASFLSRSGFPEVNILSGGLNSYYDEYEPLLIVTDAKNRK